VPWNSREQAGERLHMYITLSAQNYGQVFYEPADKHFTRIKTRAYAAQIDADVEQVA
jgi:hypothetical protein